MNILLKLILCTVGITAAGCATFQSGNKNLKTNREDSLWEYGSTRLYAAHPAGLPDTAKVTVQYAIAASDSEVKNLCDSLVRDYFGVTERSEVIGRAFFEHYGNRFLKEYTDYFATDEDAYTFPWWLSAEVDFCFIDKRYIKADFSTEVYMGGAHGDSKIRHYMIDSETSTVLKLEDICSDIPALEKRAEVHFRKANNLDAQGDLEQYRFWFRENQFHLNQNFYFDTEKITFVFNEYEIAPYFMGLFYIELPFAELKDILKLTL